MGAIHSVDVVVVARIDEVVKQLAVVDAVLHKDQAVLPHHHGIGGAMDHQELAFELVGLVFETGQLVAFRILLRGIHITLAIHDFVVLPIQHRAAGDADLEHLWVVHLQRGGHEATVAPAIATDTVGIHVRQGLQPLNARELVTHLQLAALTVDALLKGLSTVSGTTVVQGEDEEAFLGQVVEVDACAGRPFVGDQLSVRTAVHIDDDRIFLRRIEIVRLDQTGIERLAVFGFQSADGGLTHVVVLQRVFSLMQTLDELAAGVLQIDIVRHIGAGIAVEEILTAL